ncbi:MAG TPA: L-threonylcarbamoyladenylate synthase [Vicinamibacterales bacterium]
MRRVQVDPLAPQSDAIQEAATWIRTGGVVAIPTDTLYGLAVNPFDAAAVARLFAAKGRPDDRAVPLIAADAAQVMTHISPLSATAARLARRFWPGPLTLLLPAPAALARDVSAGTGRVGVRVPADHIACAVAAAVGTPVTATSANRSGESATSDPDVVERTLGKVVDFLLDTGRTPGGAPSTIVDVTADPPTLVREGAIGWEEVQACLRHLG